MVPPKDKFADIEGHQVEDCENITTYSWMISTLQGMESKLNYWSRLNVAACLHGARGIKVISRLCLEGKIEAFWLVKNYVVMYGICGNLTNGGNGENIGFKNWRAPMWISK
jgi:hypothetical protein